MKKNFLVICALSPLAEFADTKIDCPDEYPANLLSVKGVPGAWKGIAHVPGPQMALQSAGVIVGPPKSEPQGIQRGYEKKTKTGLKVEFIALDKFTEPLEKWVYCAYGVGGEVQLLQRIPDETKTCVADFTKTPYNSYRISTACK